MDETDVFTGDASIDTEEEEPTSLALFEGDAGELDLAVRQCLVVLLKNSIVTHKSNHREWDALVQNTAIIRSRLHELFLDLVLDKDKGVAYKVQVRSDTPQRFPPLIKDTSYTREETILLVLLRQRHLAESASLDPVRIDRQECLAAVASFRPDSATDEHGDASRAKRAIESLHSDGILEETDDDERFIISPVIESVLPLDQLKALLNWLREQNSTGPDPHDDEPTDPTGRHEETA
jgi:hypothetical protein